MDLNLDYFSKYIIDNLTDGVYIVDKNRKILYWNSNVFLHHKDGYRVPVLVKVIPLKNNENEIIGSVEVFSDNSHYNFNRSNNC